MASRTSGEAWKRRHGKDPTDARRIGTVRYWLFSTNKRNNASIHRLPMWKRSLKNTAKRAKDARNLQFEWRLTTPSLFTNQDQIRQSVSSSHPNSCQLPWLKRKS